MLKRLLEINKRMAEIESQTENLKGEELDNAINEVDALKAEKTEIEERMAKAEKAEKRGKAIVTPADKKIEVEETAFTVESEEYRTAFLKQLQGKALTDVEKRAMTTASDSVGSAIPTITMNKIVEKLRDAGVIYPLVTSLNINGNVVLPVEDTTADLAWKAEGVSATDSDDTLTKVELTAHKLIKTLTITAEVDAMSIDAFEAFIVEMLAKKVKVALDNAIINGSGSGQATGILEAVTPVSTAVAGTIGYDDLMDAIATLPSGYDRNAVFAMNKKTLYKQVAKIKDTNKQPIFKLETDGRFRGHLAGYPVVTCEYIPEDLVILGDFSYYYMNFAKQFEIAKDNSVAFKSGDICYRVLGLVDGKPALDEAFVVLDGTDET